MGSFADYLENEVLDHVFGNAAFSPATPLYVGLSTTTITDAGGNITEPSGNNYSRVSVTNNATNFPAAAAGAKANGTAFTFPVPSGAWGSCIDFFISDAASGGNIYCYGTLDTAQSPVSGNTVEFPIGDLDITLD